MNAYGLYLLIAIIAAASTLAIVPTYASTYDKQACPDCSGENVVEQAKMLRQNETPIAVSTDSATYDHESVIQVSGTVANLRGDTPVTVTVFNPQNNIIAVRQLDVTEGKTFETSFSTTGDFFKQDGTYTIRVQYGPQEIYNKVKVELIGAIPASGEQCASDELAVAVRGEPKPYCVPYAASGVTVSTATVSSTTTSIVLNIEAQTDGSISLTIPRNVLDAKTNGQDSDFIVLVDGQEADFTQSKSDASTRTLGIMVPAGSTEVEIIGTFAVPEFGTMAAIILAVAIVSIIAVSARSRLGVLSRY
jgi:predicted secreted protein with PEFG-CTERM motif